MHIRSHSLTHAKLQDIIARTPQRLIKPQVKTTPTKLEEFELSIYKSSMVEISLYFLDYMNDYHEYLSIEYNVNKLAKKTAEHSNCRTTYNALLHYVLNTGNTDLVNIILSVLEKHSHSHIFVREFLIQCIKSNNLTAFECYLFVIYNSKQIDINAALLTPTTPQNEEINLERARSLQDIAFQAAILHLDDCAHSIVPYTTLPITFGVLRSILHLNTTDILTEARQFLFLLREKIKTTPTLNLKPLIKLYEREIARIEQQPNLKIKQELLIEERATEALTIALNPRSITETLINLSECSFSLFSSMPSGLLAQLDATCKKDPTFSFKQNSHE